jgi:arylsulfatase A-like enzyme
MRRVRSSFCLGILILVVLTVESRAAGKPNIVLITVDSMRADRMGFLGARSRLTSALDELARQSIVFERAYAQAPDTIASTATILTGSYPQTHRANIFGTPLSATLIYLPASLHAAGYHTAAFVGSILLDPREGPFQGYDRGFDRYDSTFHQPQRGESRYRSVELHSDQVLTRATQWFIAHKEGRFFLWISLHDLETSSRSSYDHTLATTDAGLGKLFGSLRAQSLYDNTLIVIASDHGESLGAHGEETHGVFLYDETIHVPLLVKLPQGRMAAARVKNRVRLLDVAPTVLEVAGVAVPSQTQGQSLVRIANGSPQVDLPAYARSELPQLGFGCGALESWRAGKYLYVRAPTAELYDLSKDPRAIHDLAQSSKATLETMASQLQALDRRLANVPDESPAAGLTSSEMQKLASLGYVGLQAQGNGVKADTSGVDPKEIIVVVNKTLAALADVDDGKPEKAIPVLRQFLASRPKIYLAQYAIGLALAQQQQYAEAITHLHKAIELQPDSPWAQLAMGLSLMKTGDFKTAAVHLEVATGHLPYSLQLHSSLAEAYAHLGRNEDAVRERAKAAKLKDRESD